jgi:ribosomal protein S18 acetylase RimI-like enzyme
MKINICKMDHQNFQDLNQCDGMFTVASQLVLNIENGKLGYNIVSVSPYEKRYPIDEINASDYINNPEKVVFFAYADGELAGQIRILKWWNAYAYIDDIVVDIKHRRKGIGRMLLAKAAEWAQAGKFPGLMLETQNNNVAACHLYESCGFELGGFDRFLYKGLNSSTDEVALYWYLFW